MFFAHSGKKMAARAGIDQEGAARRRAFAQAEATDKKWELRLATSQSSEAAGQIPKLRQNSILQSNFGNCPQAILTVLWGNQSKKMEPMIGIEPMTYSLRVNCSTDWATLALHVPNIVLDLLFCKAEASGVDIFWWVFHTAMDNTLRQSGADVW